ncbi:MAG: hypothetical protein J6333_07240, partial [Planctomycetes bacterium]|nr:hypothetical protein [Planctomycetota bacterium]
FAGRDGMRRRSHPAPFVAHISRFRARFIGGRDKRGPPAGLDKRHATGDKRSAFPPIPTFVSFAPFAAKKLLSFSLRLCVSERGKKNGSPHFRGLVLGLGT